MDENLWAELRDLRKDHNELATNQVKSLLEITHLRKNFEDEQKERKKNSDQINKLNVKVYGFVAILVAGFLAIAQSGVA